MNRVIKVTINSRSILLFLIFFSLYLAIQMVCFNPATPIGGKVMEGMYPQKGILDMEFNYDLERMEEVLESYGKIGRSSYGRNLLTLDILYPLFSALSIIFLLGFYLHIFQFKSPLWQWILLIPLIGFSADLLENILLFISVRSFGSIPRGIFSLASLFTKVKWIVIYVEIFLMSIGGVTALIVSIIRKISRGKVSS